MKADRLKEIPVPQNEQTFDEWWEVEGKYWTPDIHKGSYEARIARKAWDAAKSQLVPQTTESPQDRNVRECGCIAVRCYIHGPEGANPPDNECNCDTTECRKTHNDELSQPVPQEEQSLPPPQLVSDEWIERVLVEMPGEWNTAKAARELQQLRAYVPKLETALLDTKRALEMRCGYAETQLLLAQARNERKGQSNG